MSGAANFEGDHDESRPVAASQPGWQPLVDRWKLLIGAALVAGVAAALFSTFVMRPVFTAKAMFIPPQSQSGSLSAALASVGSLANAAGLNVGGRAAADQFVALIQSQTVEDRIIERFKLMDVYETRFRVDARRRLEQNLRVTAAKREGLITIEFDDHEPARAADIANALIEELQRLTSGLALSEAQQRRVFFEGLLAQTRDRLTEAQRALQGSGIGSGALRAEPRAAADAYARLMTEATTTEVRLLTLRRTLADGAPEVLQARATLEALRAQLAQAERSDNTRAGPDYIGRYREYKYQETLFDLLARQFELARLDESRDGALIQVIDAATPPERKSKPKRLYIVLGTMAITVVALAFALIGLRWREIRTGQSAG